MYKMIIYGEVVREHLYASIAGACQDAHAHLQMGRRCEIVSICGTMRMSATPYPKSAIHSAREVARAFAAVAWRSPKDSVSRHFEQYTREAAEAEWYSEPLTGTQELCLWSAIACGALGVIAFWPWVMRLAQQLFPM